MMTLKKIMVCTVLASATGASALAHGTATGVVRERMDGMVVMRDHVRALTPMMMGQIPYDADRVREAAADIGQHAGDTLTALFPEGTTAAPSEAREEIWEDWETFTAMSERLGVLAVGLGAAADNGMEDGQAQGGAGSMMGGTGMMGSQGMMGGAMMGGGQLPDAQALAGMPVNGVFNMMSQVCSACHTRFRAEN